MPKTEAMSQTSKLISKEQVQYIADLARLELSEVEIEQLTKELESILEYIAILSELDTSDVKPTYSSLSGTSRMRGDQVLPSVARTEFLKEAPKHDGESVLVPVIIGAS
ncbi:MAG TPA: Asp-tRNA(Asn)/Glu-tRNA(Gln) amidotransferase subunit GatC [Bdellovibrionota bacterium]|nr:Asp-tRNA(Asn)/Glu-tRNA(Gln) amidotransferase subunit GatC [Bdellovibrionota bacterium]